MKNFSNEPLFSKWRLFAYIHVKYGANRARSQNGYKMSKISGVLDFCFW